MTPHGHDENLPGKTPGGPPRTLKRGGGTAGREKPQQTAQNAPAPNDTVPNALQHLEGVSLSFLSQHELAQIKHGLRLTLWLNLAPDLNMDPQGVRDLLHRVEHTLQEARR